jgi:hypothetical protein
MQNDRNPYAAPGAKIADPPPRPGSPYKAVALGLLTDFGGTFAFAVALSFVYAMWLAATGTPPEEIQQALREASPDSLYFWVATSGGGGFSVLSGYVCGRIARQSEYTLGVILAFTTVVIGLLIGGGDGDLGRKIVLNLATIACVMLGAWIAKKRNRKPAA